jgi:16S rRNA (cytidine1402-2'-O)-methyltransferase
MAIRQWYNKAPSFMAGTLFVVATPIGNLDDITARALRTLRDVSVIAAEDTRHTARLLAHYAIRTATTSLHEHNEHQKTAALIDRLQRGDDIALVADAGTPTISDPGRHIIQEAIRAGIRVESIPGPSAILATLVASGLPSERFTFLGFPPTRSHARKEWFDSLGSAIGTVVFFESPHRIASTLEELRSRFGDQYVVLGRELTKLHEELVRGPISAVLSELDHPRGEFTIAINLVKQDKSVSSHGPTAADLAVQFGYLTDNDGLTRRQAIAALAKRHGLSAREIFKELDRAKSIGK